MRYFYDTEFLEDGETIDLISIGIVAEDGREYYAVNRDMPGRAIELSPWLMENVFPQLPDASTWKPKEQIRDEVKAFLSAADQPDLWAWFSAYDHLVLSQLWGRMIDVPAPIPQYTSDVRSLSAWTGITRLPAQPAGAHDALQDAHHVKTMYDHIMRKVSTK
ncbi:3'-5' exoribonuclease domain-containing protein [Glutamicibacter sp. AOP3-A1-12]|uniref:3'-5' exoribonuclease domain-containing protein n=1 Tax=Glutamicibacter sp. AOP3-A1-12 TaxID=3457701 RepID=UPI004034275E